MNERTTPWVASVAGFGCLLLLATSCRKEGPPQWDVDVLAPIAHTTLTIDDLIPDSLQQVDADNNVSIFYSTELFGLSLDTVLDLPDTSFFYRYGLPFPGPITLQPGTPFFSQNDQVRFALGDVELQELSVRSGELVIGTTNLVDGTLEGDFQLPGATFNGMTVTLNSTIGPGSPGNPTISTQIRDMSDHHFDMRGPGFNDVNTLSSQFGFATSATGGPVTLTDQDSLIIEVKYDQIVPQYARGYFGMRTITIDPEVIEFSALGELGNANIDLDQVYMRLKVENGIGIDVQAYLNTVSSINTNSSNVVGLNHAITSGPVNIGRAIDLGNGFTPTLYSTQLDNSNSNADLFLENLPDQLIFAAELHINPLGDISNGYDFFYFESEISAELEVEVPLCLIASDLVLENIVNIDLPGNEEAHGIQNGTLILHATNSFPIETTISVTVVDENDMDVRPLANNVLVPGGVLNMDGVVIGATDTQVGIELGPDEVDLLYAPGRVRITATFNTSDQNQFVKISDDNMMEVQLVSDFNYVVNGDE